MAKDGYEQAKDHTLSALENLRKDYSDKADKAWADGYKQRHQVYCIASNQMATLWSLTKKDGVK